ncbi:tellurium resistance protein TerZ [Nocardia amikacinitolerans]|uniref:Tellurium resistance protein TerZ n=1 Tax=Nocardia amikacinitolerans TaxID=756689 RepID=A0A285L733_9NOCA|nr:tellurium resistance protein TerZ [Nocardia amikacinitolerans]SNY80694.1 tellurium resistance protein TerZ [Nocardia amikacinitolerans]
MGASRDGRDWWSVVPNAGGGSLALVTMGVGWDPAAKRRWLPGKAADIDLNAAALLFANDAILDVVYHEQLMSQDGAVRHLGDSTTGEDDGDDELITMDLTRIAPQVTTVILLVTCYTGQTFEQIDNAFCRVIDGMTETEIARYNLSKIHAHTGFLAGKLVRTQEGWEYRSIDEEIQAEHPVEAVPQLAPFLV